MSGTIDNFGFGGSFSRDPQILSRSSGGQTLALEGIGHQKDVLLIQQTKDAQQKRKRERVEDEVPTTVKTSFYVIGGLPGTEGIPIKFAAGTSPRSKSDIVRAVPLFQHGKTGKVISASVSDVTVPRFVNPRFDLLQESDDIIDQQIFKNSQFNYGHVTFKMIYYQRTTVEPQVWTLIDRAFVVQLTLKVESPPGSNPSDPDNNEPIDKNVHIEGQYTPRDWALEINNVLQEAARAERGDIATIDENFPAIDENSFLFLFDNTTQRFSFRRRLNLVIFDNDAGEDADVIGGTTTNAAESLKDVIQSVAIVFYDKLLGQMMGFGASRQAQTTLAEFQRETPFVNNINVNAVPETVALHPTSNWGTSRLELHTTLPMSIASVTVDGRTSTLLASVAIDTLSSSFPVQRGDADATDFGTTQVFPNGEVWPTHADFWWTDDQGRRIFFIGSNAWRFRLTMEYIPC